MRVSTLLLVLVATDAAAADLQPRTIAAFERYVKATEARMNGQGAALWFETLDEPRQKAQRDALRRNAVLIERLTTREAGLPIALAPNPDRAGLVDWTAGQRRPPRVAGVYA